VGRTVRAAGFHRRVARLLTVVASARFASARHGDRPAGDHRRPPTSCAHRLGKPKPDVRTSDVPRRAPDPKLGLHASPRLCASTAGTPGFLRPRRTRDLLARRLARSGHTVAGLGRRQHPNQDAFHRLALGLAAEVARIALAVRSHAPVPHPFACRDPAPPRQKAGWSLQTTPTGRLALRLTTRLRRRCVSPMSATDLRHEHPSD
jgi:hypothetical protein